MGLLSGILTAGGVLTDTASKYSYGEQLAKPLANGDWAVLLLNRLNVTTEIVLNFLDVRIYPWAHIISTGLTHGLSTGRKHQVAVLSCAGSVEPYGPGCAGGHVRRRADPSARKSAGAALTLPDWPELHCVILKGIMDFLHFTEQACSHQTSKSGSAARSPRRRPS